MTVETQSIDRRTIVKGAAWSAPVLAAAVATPAMAASPAPKVVDIEIITEECYPASISIVGRRPHFRVNNVGDEPLPVGAVFEMVSHSAFKLSLGEIDGPGIDVKILQGGELARIELTEPLAPGQGIDIHYLPSAAVDLSVAAVATFGLVSLPSGFEDQNERNHRPKRLNVTSVQVLFARVYACSHL